MNTILRIKSTISIIHLNGYILRSELIQKLPSIRSIEPPNPNPLHIRLARQLAVYGVAGGVGGHPVRGAAAGFAAVEL